MPLFDDQRDYLRRRIVQCEQAAEAADDPAIRRTYRNFIVLYQNRLAAMPREAT